VTWSRTSGLLFGLLLGGVVAVLALLLGPSELVVCGGGHAANRIAQEVMDTVGAGGVDGPSGNYCAVPTTGTWAVAALLFVVVTAIVASVDRRTA
jgi:hypothetical protein